MLLGSFPNPESLGAWGHLAAGRRAWGRRCGQIPPGVSAGLWLEVFPLSPVESDLLALQYCRDRLPVGMVFLDRDDFSGGGSLKNQDSTRRPFGEAGLEHGPEHRAGPLDFFLRPLVRAGGAEEHDREESGDDHGDLTRLHLERRIGLLFAGNWN